MAILTTMRNQVVTAFATKISADRALKFSNADLLPKRTVWDLSEEAEKTKYGKHDITLQLQVEVVMDANATENAGQAEGDLLDATLGQLQVDAFATDLTFEDLITGIRYTGAAYSYSDDGSNLLALSAVFEITYQFLTNDPTQQGA